MLMSNHVHLILVVDTPENVPKFIEYLKRESSHAINRLLGRRKRTVWTEGYSSPVVLDANKAIDEIVYLYTNPQRANLVETIDQYPNLSSWKLFKAGGKNTSKHYRIKRSAISELPKRKTSRGEQKAIKNSIKYDTESNLLIIDPNAWLRCFPELSGVDPQQIRDLIEKRIRQVEITLARKRVAPVLGAERLICQEINTTYYPKKFGKKMLCLSSVLEKRILYIGWFREMSKKASEAITAFSVGDFSAILPPGFFFPGGFIFSNLNPQFVPL
jgi:hypothetical protein